MSFTSELKSKPERIIQKGEIFLTIGGLARKSTGSYYTPEKIVKFLVKKGLEPIFTDRERRFKEKLAIWRKTGSKEAAENNTECLLDIRVVDPAMGSGHFLVTVVDEITRWIMGILEEYPDAPLASEIGKDREQIIMQQKKKGIKLNTELLTFNVILKRRVMKRCVYGVDLNPLAVELAKLSLWLDSFTIGTPLTFLDHHIRTGDSLIGLWMASLKARKPDNMTLDAWTGSVESIGDLLQQISYPADLTMSEVKKSRNDYGEFRESSRPLRTLLDMQAAGIIDDELQEQFPSRLSLVEETIRKGKLDTVIWAGPVKKALQYAQKYCFFHWELEFPDAFTDDKRGFDLVIMNPPWKTIEIDDDDFFSQYYPRFRDIKSKEDKEKIETKLLKDPKILQKFNQYTESIKTRLRFYSSGQYKLQRGKTDTWKLFIERAISLVVPNGTLSFVVPSGIVNNESSSELRKAILNRRVRLLYEFENTEGIFNIHRSYKFALLVADNELTPKIFPAAFYLHDINALEGAEKEKFVSLTKQFIQLIAPETFSIPEIRGPKALEMLQKLYSRHPLLLNGIGKGRWTVKFVQEMNRGNASKLFGHKPKDWTFYEGKHFHQFIPDFEKPLFTVSSEKGLEWTSRIREYGSYNKEIHNVPRLAFRDAAASTNVRTMLSCILPKHSFNSHKAPLVIPRLDNMITLDKNYHFIICYLAGIFNSMTFDFLIRQRVTTSISFFYVHQTPIPTDIDSPVAKEIVKLAARLNCVNEKFEDLAKSVEVDYGALSMKDRIEMTARLDAMVAHHYKLEHIEYEYIISSFDSFEEDKDLYSTNEAWNDSLVKRFNGEVRKRALTHYGSIHTGLKEGVKK